MPISLNGKSYKLCLLDTGIISEIVKDNNSELKVIHNRIIDSNIIPCISIWNILEIRNSDYVYDKFLEVFSIIPFMLIKDSYNIFDDEIAQYPNPAPINPLITGISMANEDENLHLKPFLESIFNRDDISSSEQAWNEGWKQDSLAAMLSLKKNFSPSGKNYNSQDAKRFIKTGVPQFVGGRDSTWKKRIKTIDSNAFPSVKMAFYTVFFRFYAEDRKPETQDVFDILIGNMAPYMDIVITENFQAEIFKKVKRFDKFIDHLKVETISDLR